MLSFSSFEVLHMELKRFAKAVLRPYCSLAYKQKMNHQFYRWRLNRFSLYALHINRLNVMKPKVFFNMHIGNS